MIIDCDRCEVRGIECGDCVVTVLLGLPAGPVELDVEERQALGVLAGGGLVPPLRLVVAAQEGGGAGGDGSGAAAPPGRPDRPGTPGPGAGKRGQGPARAVG